VKKPTHAEINVKTTSAEITHLLITQWEEIKEPLGIIRIVVEMVSREFLFPFPPQRGQEV